MLFSHSHLIIKDPSSLDALYGASIASLAIGMIYNIKKSKTDEFYKTAVWRASLTVKDKAFLNLGFSNDEAWMRFIWGGTAVIGFIFTFTGAALATTLGRAKQAYGALLLATASFWQLIYIVKDWFSNTDNVTIDSVTNFVLNVLTLVSAVLTFLTIADRIIVTGAAASDGLGMILVNIAVVVSIIYSLYNLYTEGQNWIHDWTDCNSVPAEYDSGTGCSSGGSGTPFY